MPAPAARVLATTDSDQPARVAGEHPLARATAAVLFLVLATGLVLPKVAGAGMLFLGLSGMIWLSVNRCWSRPPLAAYERLLVLAVVVYIGVWLAAWAVHGLGPAGADSVGSVLRLGLIVPIYLFLRRVDGLEPAWWGGLTAGAVIAGIYSVGFYAYADLEAFDFRVASAANAYYFGGIGLAIGLMLLPRITSNGADLRQRAVTIAALALALVACTLSATRIVWLALPPLLALFVMTLGSRQPVAWRYGVPAVLLAVMAAVIITPDLRAGERFADLVRDLLAFGAGEPLSVHLGLRWEMWKIAWSVAGENPWFGSGPGSWRLALEQAVAAGRMDPLFLEFHHPHSELLSALTVAGIPGLLALLLLFTVPMSRHLALIRGGLKPVRKLAWTGIAAMTVLAVMALSESIFERNVGVVWFVMFSACALALTQGRRRRELLDVGPGHRQRLSVIVICRDEADRIGACLESVAGWADEIVVLDSGSTDGTPEICRRYTNRVEVTDWPGYGRQKQRALARAGGDWVLSLDADEVVSDELRREIDRVLIDPEPWIGGYRLPWRTRAFGGETRFGRWSRAPLRLFRRDRARFTDAAVHEKVVFNDPALRTARLEGPLIHYLFRDEEHARTKLERYAELQAGQRRAAGRRVGVLGPWLRAATNLIDNYLLRGAFLDGRAGWIMSRLYARYTLDKYRMLRN